MKISIGNYTIDIYKTYTELWVDNSMYITWFDVYSTDDNIKLIQLKMQDKIVNELISSIMSIVDNIDFDNNDNSVICTNSIKISIPLFNTSYISEIVLNREGCILNMHIISKSLSDNCNSKNIILIQLNESDARTMVAILDNIGVIE